MRHEAHEHPLVSILVPIYNVEKYLPQCLTSLCNQTLEDIEIICINDGSTDRSLEIIKEFQEKDPRIILIDKENSGYGDSMNQGLEKARGKYIGIVESDDWIEETAFKELTAIAEESDAEVVRANYFMNKDGVDEKFSYIPTYETNHIIDPHHHIWIFMQSPAIWSAIYQRDFLEANKIKFLPSPGASYQDTGFNFKVWASAHKAQFTTEAYIHYRTDNESSSINNPGKVNCVLDEYDEIEKFLKENNFYEELKTTMWIAKGYACFWNALRLSPALAREFLENAAKGYVAANKEGLVHPEMYLGGIRAMTAALVQNDIKGAEKILKRERKLTRRAERKSRALKNLRPNYAKQVAVEKLIFQLAAQNDVLEQQVKKLRCQMEGQNE